ncbi:hypothetical protein V6N13_049596 [Hibiscus sabdariffa]|uniref:Uncharacterized protein n=1 Tax=Hibiscus sabdariffa TaxID=183260 RepID=A0ABR2QWV1_9ROSI
MPMKFRKLVFVLVVASVLMVTISATSQQNSTEGYSAAEDDHKDADADDAITMDSSGHRSLLQKKRNRRVTCKKFPMICHAKGSPGPACCKKKCVNVLKDRQNCGKCGKKCKYNEELEGPFQSQVGINNAIRWADIVPKNVVGLDGQVDMASTCSQIQVSERVSDSESLNVIQTSNGPAVIQDQANSVLDNRASPLSFGSWVESVDVANNALILS